MIDLIEFEITNDEDSEDVYAQQLLISDFGTIHNEKIYVLNYSDVTFSSDNRSSDPITYIPLSGLTGTDLARAQTYFNTFFTKLIKYIKQRNEEIDDIEKEVFSRLDDGDVKNQMYYSFKTIYDRWMPAPTKIGAQNLQSGFPLTGEPLINSFKFVDRAFNNIGDKAMLNVDSLIDFSKDFDISVFQVMSRILSENGFEFFPVENFMIFDSGVNKWEDAFKITETLKQPSTPYFIGMYIGGTSSVLDNKKVSH
ncbi:MAG: hypothetical protein HC836_36360 [Richelia sp. RM2_1_2]|nr:hypothetical protein [Richelia sp. RM2_1_2]